MSGWPEPRGPWAKFANFCCCGAALFMPRRLVYWAMIRGVRDLDDIGATVGADEQRTAAAQYARLNRL